MLADAAGRESLFMGIAGRALRIFHSKFRERCEQSVGRHMPNESHGSAQSSACQEADRQTLRESAHQGVYGIRCDENATRLSDYCSGRTSRLE
jgi:hypothetical protein